MCLVKSTYLDGRGGQQEKRYRIISVGFDRPSQPYYRLLVTAEVEVRCTRVGHPVVSQRIVRTEAKGIANMSLCFLGATHENFTEADNGVGVSKIPIKLQRMFTLDDPLPSTPGQDLDVA